MFTGISKECTAVIKRGPRVTEYRRLSIYDSRNSHTHTHNSSSTHSGLILCGIKSTILRKSLFGFGSESAWNIYIMYLRSPTAWWNIFSISKKDVTLFPSPYMCHRKLAKTEYTKMPSRVSYYCKQCIYCASIKRRMSERLKYPDVLLLILLNTKMSVYLLSHKSTRATTANARFSAVHIHQSKSLIF